MPRCQRDSGANEGTLLPKSAPKPSLGCLSEQNKTAGTNGTDCFAMRWAGKDSNLRRLSQRISSHLQLSLPAYAVCGLDFVFIRSGCSPSSLYTFPRRGLARRCHPKRFRRI